MKKASTKAGKFDDHFFCYPGVPIAEQVIAKATPCPQS